MEATWGLPGTSFQNGGRMEAGVQPHSAGDRAYPGTLLHFKLEPFGISTFRLACPVIVQLRRFKVMTQVKKCQVLVH